MSDRPPPVAQTAIEWLTRHHSGCWSAADEQAHAAWLAANPAHEEAWRHAETMWNELAGLRPFAAVELRAARATHPAACTTRPALWQRGLALAGICLLAVGLLPFLLPGSLDAAQTHQTARGEQRTLILADGSRVELNTSTRLEIDYGLACRCLRLQGGEAIFRVAHDDPRAFKVHAGNGGVRDIGTEFWMRDEPTHTAVAVLEGAVEVAHGTGVPPARLHAGERLAYDSNGRVRETAATPLADLVAWRAGFLVFRDAPLTDVLAEFARYHAVNIDMGDGLRQYRLSGRLASADFDGLLKLIQAAYPVEVRRPAADRVSIGIRGTPG